MPSPAHIETVPGGADLARALEAFAADAGILRGRVHLSGGLRRVLLRPTADAPAFALEGPVELVDAHGLFNDGPLTLRGVVAWSDRGLPRMAAGIIDEAISDGTVTAVAEVFAALAEGAPTPRVTAPEPQPEPKRSRARGRRAEPPARRSRPEPKADDAQVDLAPEIADIEAKPVAEPPKPKGGGWAAAVAASKAADRGRARKSMPSADDLGFDVEGPPNLIPGDILIHPRFGRCRVVRKPTGNKVKLRRPTGAMFDMHLRVAKFQRQSDEDGKRVFGLRIGR